MHFWIDKRSPQCGFGRSRVAASLHTGGSGLSFGHPPRRSGGHKSSSSTSSSSATASSNAGIAVHRQQQQQQQQLQAQYHQQLHSSNAAAASATTSNNSAPHRSTNYPSGSSSGSTSNNNNNSNISASAVNHATNRNFVRSNGTPSQQHHYYNNNRQYQQQQQQQQAATHHQTSNSAPNSSNNNHSTIVGGGGPTQNVTSPTGNNLNATLNNTLATTTTTTGTQQQQQHPQRYRHPQFGNMSVRTYQPTSQPHQLQQQQSTAANNATTTLTTQNSNASNQLQQQSLDASLSTLNEHGLQNQSPNQTANLSAELYQSSSPRVAASFARPLIATTMSPAICDHSNLATNPRTTYTTNASLTTGNTAQTHHHHPRQRRAARSIESTDLQFLPLHLKCGIFASLVLAVAFIVGIKVYFDNHGTKFEVGLFWLLTATFVFAFCFVSICKVPRVLFASTTSSRSNSRDQTRDRCSMDADADRGSMVNSIDDVVVSGLQCNYQLQDERQNLNLNAQAGPPPYHIAILLPETKAKEDIATLEESPPPSYDKILI